MNNKNCKNCKHCRKEKGLSGPKYVCVLNSFQGDAYYTLNGITVTRSQHKAFVNKNSVCENYIGR